MHRQFSNILSQTNREFAVLTPPRNAVQPALRADVSPRRRESGDFLSPAIVLYPPKIGAKGTPSRCQTAALYAPTVPSDKGIALLPVKYLRGFGKISLSSPFTNKKGSSLLPHRFYSVCPISPCCCSNVRYSSRRRSSSEATISANGVRSPSTA